MENPRQNRACIRFFCALVLAVSLPLPSPSIPARAEVESKGVFCPVCGFQNQPGSRFCAKDGTPLPEILPTRYQLDFVRAPETYSPEEIQKSIDHASGSVVRIRGKSAKDQKYPVAEKARGFDFYVGRLEKTQGEAHFAGSGFAVGPPGEIVTNAHVASPFGSAVQLTVETRDGNSFPARLLGIDRASDLALLKIDSDSVPPLSWGNSDKIDIGDETWAVGNPLDMGISITRGTISSIARLHAGFNQIEHFLHSDAFITHGNSGGPLLDVLGNVVGVSDMGILQVKGEGYSIPSNLARYVIGRLEKSGKYERGFLGIQGHPVDDKTIQKYSVKRRDGLVVEELLSGSPASQAGFQPGDVLFGINGHLATSSYILQEAVSSLGPGATVKMALDRGGKPMEITAITALRPEAPRIDPLVDLERYLMASFEDDPKAKGVILRVPDSFSVAHRFGLGDGAVIQAVLPAQDWPETAISFSSFKLDTKNIPVKNVEDLRTALHRAYLGGRIGVTFLLKSDKILVYSVVFDEEWPIIL